MLPDRSFHSCPTGTAGSEPGRKASRSPPRGCPSPAVRGPRARYPGRTTGVRTGPRISPEARGRRSAGFACSTAGQEGDEGRWVIPQELTLASSLLRIFMVTAGVAEIEPRALFATPTIPTFLGFDGPNGHIQIFLSRLRCFAGRMVERGPLDRLPSAHEPSALDQAR